MKKLDKKTLATLGLAGLMTFSPGLSLAAQFKDVPSNHWAYSSVDRLSDAKVIAGYPNGTFQPNRKVSYLEIMSLLRGLIDPSTEEVSAAVNKYGNLIDELKIPSWSKNNIAIALDRGIVSETTLRNAAVAGMLVDEPAPGKYPTRAMVAEFYAIALGLNQGGNTNYIHFKDQADLIYTANNKMQYNNIEALVAAQVEAGILSAQGRGDGKFHANEEIIRSEIARITDLSYDYVKTHRNKVAEGKIFIVNNSETNPIFGLERKNDSNLILNVNRDTKFMKNGKIVKFSDLRDGNTVSLVYKTNFSDNKDMAVSVNILESTLKGTGYVTQNILNSEVIRLSFVEGEKIPSRQELRSIQDFTFDKNAKITRYNDPIKKNDISYDDVVQFTADGNVITELNLIPKSATVTGNNVKFTFDEKNWDTGVLKITLANSREYTFNVNGRENVVNTFNVLNKATSNTNFTLNLNYFDVISISRTTHKETESGILKSITTTGNNLSIGLDVGGKTVNYLVDGGTKWNQGNNEAQLTYGELIKLYDYFVEVDIEDNVVKTLRPIGKDVKPFSGEVQLERLDSNSKFGTSYTQVIRITNTKTPVDGLYQILSPTIIKEPKKIKGYYGTEVKDGKSEIRPFAVEIEGVTLQHFSKAN